MRVSLTSLEAWVLFAIVLALLFASKARLVIPAVIAGAALVYGGNSAPWVGPAAAVLAIGLRAAYLRSEALAEDWKLTNRRLIGPGGRIVPLSSLKLARPFLGAVQLVTQGGDKHLIKYQANPAATVAAIEQAKAGKR